MWNGNRGSGLCASLHGEARLSPRWHPTHGLRELRRTYLDLATGFTGYSTEAKAITAFVVSCTASFPLPKTGWATGDHRAYTSGTAPLKLRHIPHAGYAVSEVSSCQAARSPNIAN